VRRLLVVCLIALFGLPLLAATPAIFIKPVVVVYPLASNGSSVDREASSRLATIIATQMANTNNVTVVPPPPGTERKDYLAVARANNADYYVSGFISPLGNGVSVVLQVVSTTTGIVVYSQSAQLSTYNDAAGQGDDLALFVARHANRGLAAIPTPPPQASSPSPQPGGGPEANLGKLFGRRPKKTPAPKASTTPKAGTTASARPVAAASAPAAALVNVTPTPSPRPAAAAPRPTQAPAAAAVPTPASARTTPAAVAQAPAAASAAAAGTPVYVVLTVEGPADAALREFATQRLLAKTGGERAQTSIQGCAAHPTRAVLSGALTVRPDAQFGGASATFDLTASDCAGKVLWHQTHSNDAGGAQGQQIATERAVDGAIGAYLNPPRRRR
jgi:TolB-like protein